MPDFILYKKDGEITNEKVLNKTLESLNDGKYLVTFKSIKKRTLPQNAYLHGCVIPYVFKGLRDAGYDDVRDNEDAKRIIKTLFLKRKITNNKTDEVIEVVKDTHELTTLEMMAFIDEVIKWAAEYLSIVIPPPGKPSIMFAHYDYDLKTTIVE